MAPQSVARGALRSRDRAAAGMPRPRLWCVGVPASRSGVASSCGRHCSALRGCAIPRRCVLPCTPKTAHSAPSNCRI